MENVHVDWFNQYLCTGEHYQSDLDIFQFDFVLVNPHDVPPPLCVNVQTEMRSRLKQLLFPEVRGCKQQKGRVMFIPGTACYKCHSASMGSTLMQYNTSLKSHSWSWNLTRACDLLYKDLWVFNRGTLIFMSINVALRMTISWRQLINTHYPV